MKATHSHLEESKKVVSKGKFKYNYFFWTYITFLFLFKTYNASETGFCLRLEVEPIELGPIDRATP
jgi:hypothetical protein